MKTLQENLRLQISARIERGELTGLSLAERAGFQQAHISNFLNQKRGLSIEGMDRILNVLNLSVVDLLPATRLTALRALETSDRDYDNVPLVPLENASDAVLPLEATLQILKFKKSFLRRLRANPIGAREHWARFILVKASADCGRAMFPRLQPNATLLIDRHYNSTEPYRKNDRTMFAVRKDNTTIIRYVEVQGRQLTLRPQNDTSPLDFITVPASRTASDFIVGRVCHIAIET